MLDQDENFYLINLSILITCVRDIVKIFFREKFLVNPVWECKDLTFFYLQSYLVTLFCFSFT